MGYYFIPNLILIGSAVGLLVLFLRRVPDIASHSNTEKVLSEVAKPEIAKDFLRSINTSGSLITGFFSAIWGFFKKITRVVWNFMLEAKDLKQSQALASGFARLVGANKSGTINLGARTKIKQAEDLIEAGEFEQAEILMFDVIKKRPHEYQAYEVLIKIYTKQKKHEELTETLEYLVAHKPDNDNYLAQLAGILMTKRRYADASQLYQRAIQINSLIPARFVNLAECQKRQGQEDVALKNFEKAADLEPSNASYAAKLVDILVKLGQNDKAKKRVEQALELNPGDVQLLDWLDKLSA